MSDIHHSLTASTSRQRGSNDGLEDHTQDTSDSRARAMVAAIAWKNAHRGVTHEYNCTLPLSHGTQPTALRGTLYRNGPGRMHAYGTKYEHLFDGDGHVQSFSFDGTSVRYRNRYVETREFVAERAAQRLLYRSTGTAKPGGLLRNAFDPVFKNAANTSAFVHGDRLYALWEGGAPHRLDPETLETVARENFDEQLLDERTWWTRAAGRELPFSAHPRIDPRTGELFNFGLANGPTQRLFLYKLSADGAQLTRRAYTLDALYFVHDFSLTPEHCVLFLCPARFDMVRTMLGVSTPLSSLQYDATRRTKIWMIPRSGEQEPIVLDAPGCFIFHHASALEVRGATSTNGTLEHMIYCRVVKSEAYPELPHPDDLALNAQRAPDRSLGFLTEFAIDLRQKTVTEQRLFDTPCELPSVLGSRAEAEPAERDPVTWAVAASAGLSGGVFTTITRFAARGTAPVVRDFYPNIPGEAVAVCDDEGTQWLMVVVFDAQTQRSALQLLDPNTLVTRASWALPHGVPPGFHGSWMPASERRRSR